MPPRKAKGKAGGKPIKPPKRPAPQSSSSDEDDGEMTLIKGMIQQLEALERAKALPSDMGAGPSGKGGRTRTRGAARTQLIDSLSVRLKAMEERLSGPSDVPVVVLDEAAVPGALQQEESSAAVEMSAVAQPGAGGAAAPVRGAGGAAAPVRVLLCGHSLVFWAYKRASASRFGTQLGLGQQSRVSWLGMQGMLWGQLLPTLLDYVYRCSCPDILVVHLGENDLGKRSGLSIIQQASSDFGSLRDRFPGMRIVWVEWLQRRVWRGVHSLRGVERARRKASKAIGRLVLEDGGWVLAQPSLSASLPHLFRPDGVHLSVQGCDLYLSNIQRGLGEVVGEWWGRKAKLG
ncbi:uncharacterized protein LOC128347333 [Hemicordylus capensis]|uniref:uncharacterized protein LOC128347333 n=1 Tax=Hemicordylus capensis TaxID=884348 RepID=UPI002302B97B|nr:uncharacterized protein LOC128347333 [Hemicordylus capensis]